MKNPTPIWIYSAVAAILTLLLAFADVAYAQEDTADAPATPEATPDPSEGGNAALTPDPPPVDPNAPVYDESIHVIPVGSLIMLPPAWVVETNIESDRWTVGVKAFVMPEAMYDTAVSKAKQLDICRPALDRCTDQAPEWLKKADSTLEACEVQFDSDEELIAQFKLTITNQDAEIATANLKLHRNRTAAGVAWAITGGILAGAATTIIVATSLSSP